ncbi:MAG: helix-turn-helix transcriptional regulator [Bacteroidales bacterium]|nr:helix-turn-helix transcriptional regulator [Bacteroidales bacterium]NPV36523.1 helix-turn-helix transcriptional regulator [Bacteroidales bacterium]
MTASQFAEAIGIQRSGLSHILSGRNQPSLDFIKKLIHRFPDVDIYWLITGEPTNKAKASPSVVQPDLFSQSEAMYEESTPAMQSNQPITDPGKRQPVSRKREETFTPGPKVSSNTRVKKIIVLYEDGTYEVMVPGD